VQTRRDQAQAQGFIIRRLSAAIIGVDPDATDQPMRRLGRAGVLGAMVAVLAVAGMTVYGYVRPGNDSGWQASGVLVVERETSTRYLFTDGVLHPVLNYTSARLALGTANPSTKSVSAASLRGVPRGLPVGILGAPDDLPPAASLVRPPWTACTQPNRDAAGNLVATSVLAAAAAAGTPVAPASGALVEAVSGQLSLLWQGQRLPLGSASVRSALGYDAVAPLPMDAAILSLIPLGPTLAPVVVPAGPVPAVAGGPGLIGGVYQTDSGSYYLLLPSGLSPLSELQARVQLAGPAYPYPGRAAIRIPAGAVTTVLSSTADGLTPATPPVPVQVAPAVTALCVTLPGSDGDDAVVVSIRAVTPGTVGAYTEPVDPTGGPRADRVELPPGGAALVRARPAPGVTTGTVYLVTGDGIKYALGDNDTAGLLGYPGVAPSALPPAWVQLLRTGPTLDKAGASRTVPVGP
jgi:type VII secretion protein EccB